MHHGVRIKDAALVAAAVLSNRYITDRFLPDKAIDLVDEAAAKLRTEIDSMPAELDEVDAPHHAARDRARGAAARRTTPPRSERLEKLEKELADLARRARRAAARAGRRKRTRVADARADCASRSSRRKVEIEQAERAVRSEQAPPS